jgi:hypothetical protein
MLHSKRLTLNISFILASTFITFISFTPALTPAFAQQQPPGVSPQALQQMQAIAGEKRMRTDAQKKIDSALLFAARAANGQPQFPNAPGVTLPQLSATNLVGTDGRMLVDIATTDATGLAGTIQSLGGIVISSFPAFNSVRASIPAAALESLAAVPSVRNIRPAEEPTTNRILPPQASSFESRSGFVRDQLSKALGGNDQGVQTNVGTGTTKSEAIVTHGADIVQNNGVTGAGVKICVISNGISSLATRQGAGELPAVQVLGTGQAGTSGDEGTAMLELVADMAPGASLGFSTGNGSPAQMAQNILDLRNVMGCNIIVDDLSYFAEAAFQEDVIANAVTTVVNAGAMYFSSSANSGHLSGGQSGTWEGDFVDGGAVSGPIATAGETGNFHNFGGSLFDTLTASATTITLKWSDPANASANDYDLFVTDSTGATLKAFSASVQNGTQSPFEQITCGANCPSGARVYVVKFSGSARALRVDTHRGRLSIGTNGSTYGHNGGVNTISVGAVSNSNFTAISGRKFQSSDTITTYSSDGPRKLFLNPVPATTPITAGCFLYACGGGTLLQKVDIAAADCNATTTPGFIPFCGTSAAAPQAAAIAALVKSSNPALTNAQVLAKLKSTAIDIMVAGIDVDSGAGIIMADAAVGNSGSTSATHDLNGDGKSDIAWRDTSGNAAIWLMNGATISQASIIGSVSTSWQIAGQRDFDGGGKSDILWRDTSGNVAIWLMNGTALSQASIVGSISNSWQISGTGDFNGDGKGDILWRDTNGNVAMWFMNGVQISQATILGSASTSWQIVGTADFNGDGKSDILWRDTSGNVAIWLMNGTTVSQAAIIGSISNSWQIVGTGDFNGDGKGDIVWSDTSGNVAIWLMNSTAISQASIIGSVSTTWQIVGTGDFNGDGKSDLLWRDTSGNVATWQMNGVAISQAAILGAISTAWTIQNNNAD